MNCHWIWDIRKRAFSSIQGSFQELYQVLEQKITNAKKDTSAEVWGAHLASSQLSDFIGTRINPQFDTKIATWTVRNEERDESFTIQERLSLVNGQLHGFTEVLSEDISDSELLKKAQNSEAQLKLIFESSPIGLFAYDKKGNITNSNDFFVNILGSTRERVMGLNMLSDLKDEHMIREVKRSLNGYRGYYEDFYEPVTGDRKNIPVKVYFNPMTNYSGDIVGGVCVVEDISETYYRDQEINELNALLSSILESTDDHIFSIDTDFRILSFNQAFRDFVKKELGYNVQLGQKFLNSEKRSFDDKNHFKRFIERSFDGNIINASYDIRLKDGDVRSFHTKFVPIRNENKVTGVAAYVRDITEHMLQEQRIKENEELLQSITESLSEAVYRSTPDEGIIYANEAFARMFGFDDPEEMYVIDPLSLYANPEDRHLFLSDVETSGRIVNQEIKYQRKDGSEFWALMNTTRDEGDDGRICYDGILIDITQRKQIEDHIRRNENLLKSINANINEGVFRLDKNGRFIYVNDAFLRLFRYDSKQEFYRMPSPEVLFENKDHFNQMIESFERDGEVKNMEVQYHRKDGTSFWAYASLVETVTNSGQVYDGALVDITERKQAQHQLQVSEETYRGLFQNASDAIYIMDPGFRFIDVNQTACEMYQRPRDFFIGKRPVDLSAPGYNDEEEQERILKKALQGNTEKFEFWATRADGTAFPKNVRLRRGVYFGQDAIFAFAEDVTKEKQAEEERTRLIQDLTRRNRDLQHFSNIISHNLRAPVANIMSLAAIFKLDNIDDETQSRVIEGMINSAENLDMTVRDLNDILSVRANLKESKEKIPLKSVIHGIRTSLSSQIEATDTIIVENFSRDEHLFAIKSYLQSVLYNLISNSIKYRHPDRAPKITVSVEHQQSDNSKIVTISDNGVGIDLKKAGDKIFGLYQRFNDHIEGKGLGLYLVKHQIEAMEWSVDVKSNPGLGTTFIITIPRTAHGA